MNSDFQFLRPEWFIMLIPVVILAWFFWSKKLFSRDWASVIDPRLLPHLLVGKTGRKSFWPLLFWLSMGMIVIVALSGPVWKKLPLPVFKQQSALVIMLDLSSSMNAQDFKPSRLVRARLKLLDLLKQRKEGQTALIAFAATAYTVSPLTDDTDTIQSLVSSLSTEIMPLQGSRTDLAVAKALELFQNAGLPKGDILLMTDGVSAKSVDKLQSLDLQDYRLSVLSIGSEQGAPIPTQGGGFIKDSEGSIVIAKTDQAELRSLASRYGGVYHRMTLDDGDLHRVQKLFEDQKVSTQHEQTDFKADRWQEEGPWLLLLITPLAALVFRRGIFLTLLLAFIVLPMPRPVLALDLSSHWPESLPNWDSLWKNTNQRAESSLQQGDAEKAAELFNRADWKAASHYKAGQYEQALEQLESVQNSESTYNRGNTLAKMDRLQEALESYDEVLKQQPEHEDAKFNRKLVEDALKKQQQQDNQNQQDGEQNNEDQQQSDQQNKDQQNKDQQNSEQSDQQQSDQQSQNDPAQQDQQDSKEQDSKQKELEQQQEEQAEKDKAEEEKKAQQQEAQKQQDDSNQNEEQQLSDEQQTEKLSEQAEAQWLRRIPDDPGGLLRNKFKYQYGRQQQPSQEKESW